MNLFSFLSKKIEKDREKDRPGRFSDFFLRAPEKEKERVFAEAARKANEQQREVFTKSQLKT